MLDVVRLAGRRAPGRARCARNPPAGSSAPMRARVAHEGRRRRRPGSPCWRARCAGRASSAAWVGARPGDAADRRDDDVGVALDGLDHGAGARPPHAMPVPASALARAPCSRPRRRARRTGRRAGAPWRPAPRRRGPPTTRLDGEAVADAGRRTSAVERPIEPVAPRMRDARRVMPSARRDRRVPSAAATADAAAHTAANPSSRSMTPPWPGMRWPNP